MIPLFLGAISAITLSVCLALTKRLKVWLKILCDFLGGTVALLPIVLYVAAFNNGIYSAAMLVPYVFGGALVFVCGKFVRRRK